MYDTVVYLAGQCKDLADGGEGWRNEACRLFTNKGNRFLAFNPTLYFSYKECKHKTQKQIKEYFLNRLSKSDICLVNLDGTNKSIGTAQEIQFAVDHNIPVIGFSPKNSYPWIAEVDCTVVFDTLEEAVNYICEYYKAG